jgi:dienelactone hydrolase/outer membrane lipoprotein-sorting protein
MARLSTFITTSIVVATSLAYQVASSQETQTNNLPAHYFIQAVSLLAGIIEPAAGASSRTFSTSLKINRADGLPKDLAGREIELAIQPPDHLRIRAKWGREELIVCRTGQELWVHAPSARFGVASDAGVPVRSAGTAAKEELMGPLKLPISAAQLMLLPLFAEMKALPDEEIEAAPCRVIELKPKPESGQALKSFHGAVQLWLRKGDSMPLRLAYRDDPGTDVEITMANPRIEPAWAEDRWKLKAGAGVRIITATNYFDNYDPTAPLNVSLKETNEVNLAAPDEGYTITRFTYDGFRGEKIPCLITRPITSKSQRLPAIIFLHGIGQNKNFLKVITAPFNRAGFIVASFDQYTQGERKSARRDSVLAELAAFVERPAKTINETRRLIDYLQTRSDVDPRRIYLVGASYGAIMGSTVMARDKRLRAGVLVYGGGDFSKFLDTKANHLGVAAVMGVTGSRNLDPEKVPLPELTSAQERQAGAVLGLVKPFVKLFFGMVDPVRYAAQISPTPVYFQNGTHDVLIPAAAAKALQDAAREPKKITWYDSDHVGVDPEQTKQVLEDGLNWLLEQDRRGAG